MTGIRPVGRFWEIDPLGFIVNDAARWRIPDDYLPAVNESVSVYRRYLLDAGASVEGIYLRGTVARGVPVRGVSDLDLFALVEGDADHLDLSWMSGVERGLLAEYPTLGGAGLDVISAEDLGDGTRFSEVSLLLSSQSVCLFGEDVISRLPRFKPGVLVANNDVSQVLADVREGVLGIESDPSPESVAYWSRRVCKNMVRTGFSLTMSGTRRFTRDLYPCYTEFAKEYPRREPSMRRAVEGVISPPQDPEKALEFLEEFGGWLSKESSGWLEKYNPSGALDLGFADHPDEVEFSRV